MQNRKEHRQNILGHVKKNMKKCSASLVNGEITMRYQLTLGHNGHHQKAYKLQMLKRVCRKGNPPVLLVGIQIDTASMEYSMEIPLKLP